jgi:hypothetical protein
MNMKTKKCGVFAALAAVLLLSAALVTSCVDQLGPGGLTIPQEKEQASFTPPPAGMGYIRLNIVNDARTVLPTIGTVTLDQFSVYISELSTSNVTTYTSNTPITLPAGTYNIRVVGLESGVAKAAAEIPEFTLVAGVNQSKSVTLKEIVTEGTGTFAWTLTNPGANAGATVTPTLVALSTNASSATMGGITGSISLNAGYYLVETTMTESGKKPVKVVEALHIYRNFTSTYTATLPVLKPNVYTVTFYDNIASGGGAIFGTAQTVNHGGYATMPSPDPVHTNTDMGFTGWYTEIDCENVFVFDEVTAPFNSIVQIIKDYNLYAGWLDTTATTAEVRIVINGTPSYPGDKPLQLSGVVSSVNRNATVTVTVTVDNSTDYSGGIVWTVDNETPVNGPTLTLNYGLVANKIIGDWHVSVVGTAAGGIPYSANFIIDVKDTD